MNHHDRGTVRKTVRQRFGWFRTIGLVGNYRSPYRMRSLQNSFSFVSYCDASTVYIPPSLFDPAPLSEVQGHRKVYGHVVYGHVELWGAARSSTCQDNVTAQTRDLRKKPKGGPKRARHSRIVTLTEKQIFPHKMSRDVRGPSSFPPTRFWQQRAAFFELCMLNNIQIAPPQTYKPSRKSQFYSCFCFFVYMIK